MRGRDPVIDMLRAIPGLRSQRRRALAALAPLVDQAEIRPGSRLIREGVAGREAFVVVDGCADVFVDGELVATVGPGEFLGEMSMLDGGPRSATVRAKTPMSVLVVGPKAFAAFAAGEGVGRALATQLARRLREADARLR